MVGSVCCISRMPDVCASVQVLLEFAIDDTAGGENEDALTEIGFYVPKEAAGFQDGEEHPAKVRRHAGCTHISIQLVQNKSAAAATGHHCRYSPTVFTERKDCRACMSLRCCFTLHDSSRGHHNCFV